jgi:uncharacterized protein YndB with AHSA1/START domain
MAGKTDNSETKFVNDALVITRIFDSPRTLVWNAWSYPEQLMRWWGPKNFTAPVCKTDFRVGGKYLYCMRSKEDQDFWSTGTFVEIVPLEKIVYTDCFADEKGNPVHASHYGMPGNNWPMELKVTIQFEDLGDKTKMILTHAGLPSGQMIEMCGEGWNQSFDKLAESL